MFRSIRASATEKDGFTLIEALCALAVLAAGLSAVAQLAGSNMRAAIHAEEHLAGVAALRKVVADLPPRNGTPRGVLNGALGSYAWRMEAMSLDATAPAGNVCWEPQKIALSVRSPTGATVSVDMIRLRRINSK